MAINMPPVEELIERWVRGNARYLQAIAEEGGSHQQVTAALAFHTRNVSTVRHAKIEALELRLNREERHALGWEPGTPVRKIVPRRGVLLVMSAAESDIPLEFRVAMERAGSPPEKRPDMQNLPPRIKVCKECHAEFTTPRFSLQFCDTCRRLRAAGAALQRALLRFREVVGQHTPSVGNFEDLPLLREDAAEADRLVGELPPAALPKARRPKGTGSIRQRGNILHIAYYRDGKRCDESSRSSEREVAELLLSRRIKEAARGQGF